MSNNETRDPFLTLPQASALRLHAIRKHLRIALRPSLDFPCAGFSRSRPCKFSHSGWSWVEKAKKQQRQWAGIFQLVTRAAGAKFRTKADEDRTSFVPSLFCYLDNYSSISRPAARSLPQLFPDFTSTALPAAPSRLPPRQRLLISIRHPDHVQPAAVNACGRHPRRRELVVHLGPDILVGVGAQGRRLHHCRRGGCRHRRGRRLLPE